MVTIVVGGQYGSEAKSKAVVAAASVVPEKETVLGIRTGGTNAGHTVYFGDQKYVLRTVPALVANPRALLLICSGAMIDPLILDREIREITAMGVNVVDRLIIDPMAVVVEQQYIDLEKNKVLGERIGSTLTGTGATMAARVMRTAKTIGEWQRTNVSMFESCIAKKGEVAAILHHHIRRDSHVFVEGTQGFGLSMLHSDHYPYCTSRDTTASAFASEAGISPRDVNRIIMVIRTWPIRVGGNSGLMYNEVSWDYVQEYCGSPDKLIEMTSVTKKVRRVGMFDWDLVIKAMDHNRPTSIAIHGLDYLEWSDRGKREYTQLSQQSRNFARQVADRLSTPVSMVMTGPHQDDVMIAGGNL